MTGPAPAPPPRSQPAGFDAPSRRPCHDGAAVSQPSPVPPLASARGAAGDARRAGQWPGPLRYRREGGRWSSNGRPRAGRAAPPEVTGRARERGRPCAPPRRSGSGGVRARGARPARRRQPRAPERGRGARPQGRERVKGWCQELSARNLRRPKLLGHPTLVSTPLHPPALNTSLLQTAITRDARAAAFSPLRDFFFFFLINPKLFFGAKMIDCAAGAPR